MLKAFNNDLFVCGVDEAGRGCLAGPVTAAAVILPKNYKNKLIQDSKKLNAHNRMKLYDEITSIAIDVTAITKIIFDDKSAIKFPNYKCNYSC